MKDIYFLDTENKMEDTYFFDASNHILGRLSSTVVPLLLGGKKVVVVNAEKAIITGNPKTTEKKYLQLRARKTQTNPRRGPFFPRFPDRILRRTVRGMLPYKTKSGRYAFNRLSAFIGVPDDLKEQKFQTINSALFKKNCPHITLEELGRKIGWRYGIDDKY